MTRPHVCGRGMTEKTTIGGAEDGFDFYGKRFVDGRIFS